MILQNIYFRFKWISRIGLIRLSQIFFVLVRLFFCYLCLKLIRDNLRQEDFKKHFIFLNRLLDCVNVKFETTMCALLEKVLWRVSDALESIIVCIIDTKSCQMWNCRDRVLRNVCFLINWMLIEVNKSQAFPAMMPWDHMIGFYLGRPA